MSAMMSAISALQPYELIDLSILRSVSHGGLGQGSRLFSEESMSREPASDEGWRNKGRKACPGHSRG